MPADFGVSELLAAEYQRFLEGLADLSDGGQRAARAAAARIRPDQPQTRTIPLPGWDDVIHITPRPIITTEMRAAHYAARRRGLPSPLAPELQSEISRRAARARQMQQSPTPEYARAYGQVLTAIDNVQDLLTTAATTGRFALGGAARVLDRLAPTAFGLALNVAEREAIAGLGGFALRSEAARLGLGLGARTLGRVLPIIGPILLAADILRLLAWLGMAMFPGYAAICQGLRQAGAAAALPATAALLNRRAAKRTVSQLGRVNPFSREARLNRSQTVRAWRPTIYNLLEVAQTTDQLFGVGVSFGALVGLVSDSAFGVEQQLRGVDVRVDASPLARSFHAILAPGVEPLPTAQLTDMRAAANVLAHGPTFQRVQETLTLEEHTDALAAQLIAWSLLRPVIELPEMERAVNDALAVELMPPAAQYDDTPALLLEEIGEASGVGLWPMPDTPARLSGEELMTRTAFEIPRALRQLAINHDEEPARDLCMVMASQLADRAGLMMTGAAEGIVTRWTGEYALLETLALNGRVPVLGVDDEAVLRFWEACRTEMDRSGRQMLDLLSLDRLVIETDCPVLIADSDR